MARRVRMKNAQNGLTVTGFYGFSWTALFFSGIPMIMRGEVGIGLGVLAASLIGGVFFVIPALIVGIVWAFTSNRYYTRRLIERGYSIDESDPNAREAKQALGIA